MPSERSREYELVPMAPIRKLERRMDDLESSSDVRGFLKEIIEIIRMNQQIVEELMKANDSLRIELSKLPARIEDLTTNLKELLTFVKASATEEITGVSSTSMKPLVQKMEQLVEANKKIVETNQSMLSSLEEMSKKFRRPLPHGKPLARRPLSRPRPIIR